MERFLQLLLTRTACFPRTDRALGPQLTPKHLSKDFFDAVLHPYSPLRHPASHCLSRETSQPQPRQNSSPQTQNPSQRPHQCWSPAFQPHIHNLELSFSRQLSNIAGIKMPSPFIHAAFCTKHLFFFYFLRTWVAYKAIIAACGCRDIISVC